MQSWLVSWLTRPSMQTQHQRHRLFQNKRVLEVLFYWTHRILLVSLFFLVFLLFWRYPIGIDDVDAGLACELAHKTKHANTASETTSLPEQKCFSGFCFISLAALSVRKKKQNKCLIILFFAHLFVL